uniref:G-protein coupled receptors family 1 profile domain-containing protein n=1 Tax=Pyxicephalus adspersus TaxID=30357 RepID=A0AAV2ZX52_PYXAD|nr:TPA: hypothetical protein GDO54_014873 [Pyxicephalus adspersus]
MLKEFLISGLSELPALPFPLFLFFLLIYLLTLIWNLLIIVLIVTDSHLHVPIYFFVGNLIASELLLLAVMSYDQYAAIYYPLHYLQIMRWKVCVELSFIIHCIIESFFCDFPQLFQISCSDISSNILLCFHLAGFLGVVSIFYTLLLLPLNALIHSLRNQNLKKHCVMV